MSNLTLTKLITSCAIGVMLTGCSTADWGMIMDGVTQGLDQAAQTQQRDAARRRAATACPYGQYRNTRGYCVSVNRTKTASSSAKKPSTSSRTTVSRSPRRQTKVASNKVPHYGVFTYACEFYDLSEAHFSRPEHYVFFTTPISTYVDSRYDMPGKLDALDIKAERLVRSKIQSYSFNIRGGYDNMECRRAFGWSGETESTRNRFLASQKSHYSGLEGRSPAITGVRVAFSGR